MAAIEVGPDGHVIPPLNITQPAPFMSLKGFEWNSVTDDIQLAPPSQKAVSHRAAGDAPAGQALLPEQKTALPDQLTAQLELNEKPKDGPDFPLLQFHGAYAGNGFNLIWRPRKFGAGVPDTFVDLDGTTVQGSNLPGPHDNVLQLNLTLEQTSFGPPLGKIPNRGFGKQDDIILFGVPYLQTLQDVTNPNLNPKQTGIHFEPGVWLYAPKANFHDKDSIVRMASIPHGTTINAQGFVPQRTPPGPDSVIGGVKGAPNFLSKENTVDARPFSIGNPDSRDSLQGLFPSLDAGKTTTFRIPQNLQKMATSKKITTELIKNPNLFLNTAIQGLNIAETITFEVHTGPAPPAVPLNGGGTANIAFLAGEQPPGITSAPDKNSFVVNAHAGSMTAKYWVQRVMYQVKVVGPLKAGEETKVPVMAQMPEGSTAPTPKFLVTAPPGGLPAGTTTVEVPGIQIQSSQTVLLNFGTLSWPHISVSTLVPVDAQRVTAPTPKK